MTERRDIESPPEASSGASGRRVIAVVGIDRYASWRRLTNAVNDARGAAALFGRLGFEQLPGLFDEQATGKAIEGLVKDDLKRLGSEDSLVLFYAGHGATREHRLGSQVVKTGYLIPIDASDRMAAWIELDSWLRAVSLLPARHILVILDACHSGIALGPIIKWRDLGTPQGALSTLQARRSRRIITSALDDQMALDSGPVHGHSLFTGCLIEALTHGLARAGDRMTTGSELGLYVQRRVATYPSSSQTPDFGAFDFDDRGEMVIPLEPAVPISDALLPLPEPLPTEPASPPILPVPQGSAGRAKPSRRLRRLVAFLPLIAVLAVVIYFADRIVLPLGPVVSGELSISGRDGSWTARLTSCRAGQPSGFFGIDLDDPHRNVLRVIIDPITGPRVIVHAPISNHTMILTPQTCPGLIADVRRTGTIIDFVYELEGEITFDCALPGGGDARLAVKFKDCSK